MAQRLQSTTLVIALVTMTMWVMASAQSSSCTNVLVSMSPCLSYITGNSSTPSSGCCSQLSSVVRSQPECLCEVLNGGGSSMGLNINQTRALAMPGACGVQTPPLSRCNAASPADSPAGAADPSDIPSGTGSKTVPTTDEDTSHGSSTKMSIPLLFFAVFAAAYASA